MGFLPGLRTVTKCDEYDWQQQQEVSTSVFQYDFYSQDVIFLPLDKDIELSFKGISRPIFLETGLKSWMFFLKTEHKEAILKCHFERLVNILSAFS